MDTEVADELDQRYTRLLNRSAQFGATVPAKADYALRLINCAARRCKNDPVFFKRYLTIAERLPGLTSDEQANIYLSCQLLPRWDGYANVIAISPEQLREALHEAMRSPRLARTYLRNLH